MPKPDFKNPFGLHDGRLFLIGQTARGDGREYVCPACKAKLVAKRGGIRRAHFAHHSGFNCNPETIIHKAAKFGMRDRIVKAMAEGRELPITWICQNCKTPNKGNLARRANTVEVEENLGVCQPDVVVHGVDGQPVLFIEIYHKHEPEENVYEYARLHKIGVVTFKVDNEYDVISLLESKVMGAWSATPCKMEACRNAPVPAKFATVPPPAPVTPILAEVRRATPPPAQPRGKLSITDLVFGIGAIVAIWVIFRGIWSVMTGFGK